MQISRLLSIGQSNDLTPGPLFNNIRILLESGTQITRIGLEKITKKNQSRKHEMTPVKQKIRFNWAGGNTKKAKKIFLFS